MVDEAGELRQPLGLGEAVSVTLHKSGKQTQDYEQEPFFLSDTHIYTVLLQNATEKQSAESRVQ